MKFFNLLFCLFAATSAFASTDRARDLLDQNPGAEVACVHMRGNSATQVALVLRPTKNGPYGGSNYGQWYYAASISVNDEETIKLEMVRPEGRIERDEGEEYLINSKGGVHVRVSFNTYNRPVRKFNYYWSADAVLSSSLTEYEMALTCVGRHSFHD